MAEIFRPYFGAFYLLAYLTTYSHLPARAQSALPQLHSNWEQFIELVPRAKAPPLIFERLDGRLTSLQKFSGKVVLLSFWATWCPPCRRELPSLERLAGLTDPRQLQIVPVAVDRTDKAAVERFLRRLNVNRIRTYLVAPERVVGSVENAAPFPLYGLPITYLIDKDQVVIGYVTGDVDWASAEALSFLEYFIGK